MYNHTLFILCLISSLLTGRLLQSALADDVQFCQPNLYTNHVSGGVDCEGLTALVTTAANGDKFISPLQPKNELSREDFTYQAKVLEVKQTQPRKHPPLRGFLFQTHDSRPLADAKSADPAGDLGSMGELPAVLGCITGMLSGESKSCNLDSIGKLLGDE